MYVLKFTTDAVADVKAIPKHIRNRLKKVMTDRVAKDPDGCSKELHGSLSGYRGFCWQDYRVIYRVFADLRAVAVVGIGLRDAKATENIYRKLEALAVTGKLAQGVLFSIRGFSTIPAPKP